MRVIDRLHRKQTEFHTKLIILAERRSEIAKATELKKQDESKNKQQQYDIEENSQQEDGSEDNEEVIFLHTLQAEH